MSIFWIIFAIVAVVFIILALKRFPVAKTILGVLVVVAALVAGVYSSVNLYSYYTASGGVYGELSGFFDVNKGTSEEFTFKITNIELKQVEGDKYSATITTDTVLELEDTDYCLFVNDMPCQVETSGIDYMIGNYTYNFYDEGLALKLQDTLDLKFVFNKYYSQLTIETEGGADAVKLWNYYFNKNDFVVRFAPADYIPNKDLDYTEGEVPETCVVTYEVDGVQTQALIPIGTQISSITYAPTKTFYKFDGWTLDGETTVNPNYTIQDDTTLIATFSLAEAGLYDSEGNMKETWDELLAYSIDVGNGTLSWHDDDDTGKDGTLIIADTVTYIYDLSGAEFDVIYMPDTVTSIANSAFKDAHVQEIVLSKNITQIEDYTFYGSTLQNIVLPEGVISIGKYAFYNTSLQNVVIPDGVTSIGECTFALCDDLVSIVIPETVTYIGKHAFLNCSNLASIYIPASVETMEGTDTYCLFSGCNSDLKVYCGAEQRPAGWGVQWNSWANETHWGYTYEEYLAEIQ